jgi:hypothetical protein
MVFVLKKNCIPIRNKKTEDCHLTGSSSGEAKENCEPNANAINRIRTGRMKRRRTARKEKRGKKRRREEKGG